MRALLLLLFYAFLPFALVFSGYRFSRLIMGSIFLLSLILWSYIWQLVQWVDSALIQALYQGWLFQHTPQAVLVDSVVALLMIIAPLFWFTVMGALGVAVGQQMERLIAGLLQPIGANATQGITLAQKHLIHYLFKGKSHD